MTTPHPWNDLEQRFLQFTITAKELANAIGTAVDDGRVPADIIDTVSNLAIGLKSYIEACEDEIATAMEQKICHDYRVDAIQQAAGVVVIDDDYTVQLPRYAADLLKWSPGCMLRWKITNEGTVSVQKMDR